VIVRGHGRWTEAYATHIADVFEHYRWRWYNKRSAERAARGVVKAGSDAAAADDRKYDTANFFHADIPHDDAAMAGRTAISIRLGWPAWSASSGRAAARAAAAARRQHRPGRQRRPHRRRIGLPRGTGGAQQEAKGRAADAPAERHHACAEEEARRQEEGRDQGEKEEGLIALGLSQRPLALMLRPVA